jgi:hypothetical protein
VAAPPSARPASAPGGVSENARTGVRMRTLWDARPHTPRARRAGGAAGAQLYFFNKQRGFMGAGARPGRAVARRVLSGDR